MLTTISDAINKIFENLPHLNDEVINIEHALGRVLSQDIISNINMPPFDKSAVDGYAVLIEDTPGNLHIKETVQAGSVPKQDLSKGEATLIMTGAPIPTGTEAVVMREYTKEEKEYVEILKKAKPKDNIAYMGEDIKKGDVVIEKGTIIKISDISLLATLGIRRVKVKKLPVVSIMVTGSELIEPGEENIKDGYIYNANGYSLRGACKELGIEPIYLGIIKDNIEAAVSGLTESENGGDITLISGGVSMGDYDYVEDAIKKWGGKIIFHRVAIKPGKPFLFARKNSHIVFGMPGNPVSVMVEFWKFIHPAILKMQGVKNVFPIKIPALFKGTYKKKSDRPHYIGVKLVKEGKTVYATHVKSNGSADVPAFNKSEGMIEVPQEVTQLNDGENVEVMLLSLPKRENER